MQACPTDPGEWDRGCIVAFFSRIINRTDTDRAKRFDTKRADAAMEAADGTTREHGQYLYPRSRVDERVVCVCACDAGRQGKLPTSAHVATALRTVGIEFFRINLSAGPRSVIGTVCHPVTSGMSPRFSVCRGDPVTGRPVDWKYGDSLRDGGVLIPAMSFRGALGSRIPVDSIGGD